jgi:hypothetical protein
LKARRFLGSRASDSGKGFEWSVVNESGGVIFLEMTHPSTHKWPIWPASLLIARALNHTATTQQPSSRGLPDAIKATTRGLKSASPNLGFHRPMSRKAYGHFTHEPRAMTVKSWEPERECSKAIPRHLQSHVVWPWTLECSVKSYVIGPSTNCYFNDFLFTWVLIDD